MYKVWGTTTKKKHVEILAPHKVDEQHQTPLEEINNVGRTS